jgi:hypothetical protein
MRRAANHHALKIAFDPYNAPFCVSIDKALDDLKRLHRSAPGAVLNGNAGLQAESSLDSGDSYTTNILGLSYYKVMLIFMWDDGRNF